MLKKIIFLSKSKHNKLPDKKLKLRNKIFELINNMSRMIVTLYEEQLIAYN